MSKKIESMTAAQEKMVPVYLNKWLANGRSTERLDRAKAIEAIKTIYRVAKLDEPKHIFFFPSPLQCQLAANLMKSKSFEKELGKLVTTANLRRSIESNLGINLRSNLEDNLWINLGINLRDNLRDNLWSNIGSNIGNNLWSTLEGNLGNNILDNLEGNLENNLLNNLWINLARKYENIFYGNLDVYWESTYDFILNELFSDQIEKYKDFIAYCDALKEIHVFIPYKDIVFVSDRPTSIKLNDRGRLHSENDPSLMYEDGYSLFNISGVMVPKWVVETPKDKLEASKVLTLPNAEQRLVAIKKLGVENMLYALEAKSISTKTDEYTLYEVVLEGSKEKLLKMKNQSEDKTHYEWVEPHINTVNEALMWRLGWNSFKEPVAKT